MCANPITSPPYPVADAVDFLPPNGERVGDTLTLTCPLIENGGATVITAIIVRFFHFALIALLSQRFSACRITWK